MPKYLLLRDVFVRLFLLMLTAALTVVGLAPGTPAVAVSNEPIVGEWQIKKCFTSGSPQWTTVVGRCFEGTWTFSADGRATDGGTFIGTWSGEYPDYSASFDRKDAFSGSETVSGLEMTSRTAAFGEIVSVADCNDCGTAQGDIQMSRTGDPWGCGLAGTADAAGQDVVFLMNEDGKVCEPADVPAKYAHLTVLDATAATSEDGTSRSGLALGDQSLTKGADGPTINFFFGSGSTEREALTAAGRALAAYEDDPAHINTCYVFHTQTVPWGLSGFTAIITAGCVP